MPLAAEDTNGGGTGHQRKLWETVTDKNTKFEVTLNGEQTRV